MKLAMTLLPFVGVSLSVLPFSLPAHAEEEPASQTREPPELGTYGFDTSGMDTSIKPGDDFYAYANGAWAARTEIPDDRSNYGTFVQLDDLAKTRIAELLEAEQATPGSKVGDAYASYVDEAAVERSGLKPIKPWLQRIRAIRNKSEFGKLLPVAARNGITTLFDGFVAQDDDNPDAYIYHIFASDLGMPNVDLYSDCGPKFELARAAYKKYLADMLELAGEMDAAARADAIFSMEKDIAKALQADAEAGNSYNRMTLKEINALTPRLKMTDLLQGLSKNIHSVIVEQPNTIKAISTIYLDADVSVLKDQMIVRSLKNYSDVLPNAISETVFSFFGTNLSAKPKRLERWKRAVEFTEGVLGEDVGKIYAARYFPAESKAAIDVMVDNIKIAVGRRIDTVGWMQPETRQKAKQKLARLTVKIGHPDRWKDYSTMQIVRGDLFGNLLRANQWKFDDNMNRLGGPIRRWEWGILPQTVNSYTNYSLNEVVVSSGILQPPFFDPNADPAINYGAIGATIAKLFSQHFDDQGSKYDQNGRLSEWWTEKDVEAFKKASQALVAQYDKYEIFPGAFVKGEFTLGENIGDLAGLNIAYDAYKASLGGKEAPVIDGMTGDQRFFLGWAQVWRRNYREANLRNRLITDPHSPSQQRVSVVRNLDKWYDAFQPKEGEKLFLKPGDRVRIW